MIGYTNNLLALEDGMMCILITGYVNNEGYNEDFFALCDEYDLGYAPQQNGQHKRKNVSKVNRKTSRYMLITQGHCDCGTALGAGDEGREELTAYMDFFKKAAGCKGVRYIGILKHWYEGLIDEEVIHVKEVVKIPVSELNRKMLAELKKDRFYEIQY